jgi:hypothetical protein
MDTEPSLVTLALELEQVQEVISQNRQVLLQDQPSMLCLLNLRRTRRNKLDKPLVCHARSLIIHILILGA